MKKVLCLVLVLAMVLAMAGCATAQAEEPEESVVEVEPLIEEDESEPEEELPFDWSYLNPLTGEATEEDISNNRPIAVMLNNIRQALPQYGNSQADVYYEVPEEGGITRIMALYQDVTDVGTLGSIRSTRPYYVRLALAADSILVHAGGSTTAYNVIKDYMEKYDFVDLDFLSKGTRTADIFYRDSGRLAAGYASEHTLFTTSDSIQTYLEEHSDEIRLEHEDSYEYVHYFVEDGTPANGDTAETIDVSFSGYKGTTFTYDSETGKYMVSEFDSAYVDGATGTQVSVENVVVIQTKIEELNDSKNHVAVYLTGTGSGYFACNGKYEKITWEKEKAKYTYQFYDEDGNVVDLGVGKTYVCIVSTERDITVDGVVLEKPEEPEETEETEETGDLATDSDET